MATQRPDKTDPASQMNAWVRAACDAAGMSYQTVGDEMTRRGVGNYDRSKVQKMTVSRRVTIEEAAAISQITGYPLPVAPMEDAFREGYSRLSQVDREVVDSLIQRLLVVQGER